MTIRGAAMQAGSPRDLMRGGSDLVELSLVASRARSAAIRASQGVALDEFDRTALEAMSGYLEDAARSVEFFASGGTTGTPPHGALNARVDATIDAVVERPRPEKAQVLAEQLSSLAAAAAQVEAQPTGAAELADFFRDLSSSVLKRVGHVGETTAAF